MSAKGVHPVIAGLARTGHIREQAPCRWRYDSDDLEGDSYFTGCDNRAVAWDVGTPIDHGYRFCPYCGSVLKVATR